MGHRTSFQLTEYIFPRYTGDDLSVSLYYEQDFSKPENVIEEWFYAIDDFDILFCGSSYKSEHLFDISRKGIDKTGIIFSHDDSTIQVIRISNTHPDFIMKLYDEFMDNNIIPVMVSNDDFENRYTTILHRLNYIKGCKEIINGDLSVNLSYIPIEEKEAIDFYNSVSLNQLYIQASHNNIAYACVNDDTYEVLSVAITQKDEKSGQYIVVACTDLKLEEMLTMASSLLGCSSFLIRGSIENNIFYNNKQYEYLGTIRSNKYTQINGVQIKQLKINKGEHRIYKWANCGFVLKEDILKFNKNDNYFKIELIYKHEIISENHALIYCNIYQRKLDRYINNCEIYVIKDTLGLAYIIKRNDFIKVDKVTISIQDIFLKFKRKNKSGYFIKYK